MKTEKEKCKICNSIFGILRKPLTIRTNLQLCRIFVCEICLCVLQTAVGLCVLQTAFGSLQSADCDTEWLIGVNLQLEGFCVEKEF
jgi:hypothetical protein